MMAVQIQLRRDTAANWTSANPTLAAGEMGFETDTLRYKLGDGLTAWNDLQYGVFDGFTSGRRYVFDDTTTDGDPGEGKVRFDNATFGSITELYFDNTDYPGGDATAWLDALDSSSDPANKGTLFLQKHEEPGTYREFIVSGSVTDGTGYRKVPVTPLTSNGDLADGDQIVVAFYRTGAAGTIETTGTKTDLVDADTIIIKDSEDSGAVKEVSVDNFLGAAFAALAIDEDDFASDSATKLPTQQSTKAYVDASIAALQSYDPNIALLALEIADLKGDRMGMVGGIADPFDDETDVDTAASTNEVYSAANDLYSPTGDVGSAISQAAGTNIGNMTEVGGLAAAFDGNASQINTSCAGRTDAGINTFSSYVGKTHTSAVSKVEVSGSNSHGYGFSGTPSITIRLYGKQGSAPANATDGTELGSITFTDTADESAARTITSSDLNTVWDHRWVTVAANANTAGFYFAEVVFYGTTPNNMTLVSNAFTADAEPDTGRVAVQVIENESITINTDLTAEISRDGGTTWATATLALAATNGSVKLYQDNEVDISGQPSGTSMMWRVKTHNNKDIDVSGVVLQWK